MIAIPQYGHTVRKRWSRWPWMLLALLCVLGSILWIVAGRPGFGELYTVRYYIDIDTGNVQTQRWFGNLKMLTSLKSTRFAAFARDYGTTGPARWRFASAVSYPGGKREEGDGGMALASLTTAVEVADSIADTSKRRAFLGQCLILLRNEKLDAMRTLIEDTWREVN